MQPTSSPYSATSLGGQPITLLPATTSTTEPILLALVLVLALIPITTFFLIRHQTNQMAEIHKTLLEKRDNSALVIRRDTLNWILERYTLEDRKDYLKVIEELVSNLSG
jgi:hypothetical protein